MLLVQCLTYTPNCRSQYPPDYISQLMEDFTVICHFCFMDVSSALIGQSEDSKPSGISTGQILSNLVSVFNPLSASLKTRMTSAEREEAGKERGRVSLGEMAESSCFGVIL